MSDYIVPAEGSVLRAAREALDAAGVGRGTFVDAVLASEYLSRAVLDMTPRRLTTRWVGAYAPWGFVVHTAPRPGVRGDRSSAGGVCYLAAALALAASRVEEGVWEFVPGCGVPCAAAASVLLSNGWARVIP